MSKNSKARVLKEPHEMSEEEWLATVESSKYDSTKWQLAGGLVGVMVIGIALWVVFLNPLG